MGFYKDNKDKVETNGRGSGIVRWAAVVVVSALVGSGATVVMLPMLNNSGANLISSLAPVTNSTPVATTVSNVTVNDGIVAAVKKVKPAVVGVVNYSMQQSNYFSQQSQLQPTGVGTGLLFYKDNQYGYIVTNNHVVEGAAKVSVVLNGSKHIDATVVGTDPFTDLAVLKIPVANVASIEPAQFADSSTIQVGEPAIAIGTPMGLDFADSVTAGIISAASRVMPVQDPQTQQTLDYEAVIQTDASINPGNSGGPLLNINGQVMGINSSKIVATGFQGMGFAIPSNEVRNIAEQIMQTGHAVHPALGITGYDLSTLPQQYWPNVPVDYGVWVKDVTSSDSQAAGLKPQDVIVGIDNHVVNGMSDLRTYLFQKSPGQTVTLKVYRGSQHLTLTVKLGKMNVNAASSGNSSGSTGLIPQGNSGSGGTGGSSSLNPLTPPSSFGN
ncbi:MAG: peptidase S1 [Alicyclobacillus sp. RIFOXYA1_FULL_53_8]|nr:MAG: peptidase S1 [Alicyclobacillus sp. RIFOXYA1_FULL_53_8]